MRDKKTPTSRTSRPRSAQASRSGTTKSTRPSSAKARPQASASRPRPSSARPAARSSRPSGAAQASRATRSSATRPPTRGTRPQPNTRAQAQARRAKRRRAQQLRWGRIIAIVAVLALCVGLGVWAKGHFFPAEDPQTTVTQSETTPLVSDADKPGFDETINSSSAILINAGNGDILYEKDADTRRAPASLTKMMTVYVAIKNTDNLDKTLTMPKAAYEGLEENSASQSGLKAGEKVTVRDLLYATLLSSGGDAANALALTVSGNLDGFVKLMNDEAKTIGMDSTTFVNPTGLDASKQRSTCRDLARLLKTALGDATFEEVFTSRDYTTSANDEHPDGLKLSHTMEKDLSSFQRYFDTSGYQIVGGKTGYTEDAGNCLASLAEKDGAPSYIAVTMHATGTGDQYYQAVHDAVTLYGEAYDDKK
ncbi:MAG: serine hydrolase [Peptococcaceae bacterium]|nr:serine hydrolase [Peptococcaceae bacterium]